MKLDTKFVCFNIYCPQCKFAELVETEDPCNECLTTPINTDSHKPVNFEDK